MLELLALVFIVVIYLVVWLDSREPKDYGDRSKHRQNSEDYEDLCQ